VNSGGIYNKDKYNVVFVYNEGCLSHVFKIEMFALRKSKN